MNDRPKSDEDLGFGILGLGSRSSVIGPSHHASITCAASARAFSSFLRTDRLLEDTHHHEPRAASSRTENREHTTNKTQIIIMSKDQTRDLSEA